MSPMLVLAAIALATPIVAVAAFVAARRLRHVRRQSWTASQRLVLAVGAALLIAIAVSYVTAARASNTQTFALSGAERWTVGPVLYVSFALLLVMLPGRGALANAAQTFLRSPSGALALLVLTTGSAGLLLATTTPLQTAQGLALIIGFCLFMVVGAGTIDWTNGTRRGFTALVACAGLLTVVLQTGLGSFPAIAVPACAAVIALARSHAVNRAVRVGGVLLGSGTVLLMYVVSADSNDPSAGLQLQMGFALLIVLVAMSPRRLRPALGALGIVEIIVAVVDSPLAQITVGGLSSDPDLTIAQRGFETRAVWDAVSGSPLTLLLGLGPGATVDLHRSPDAATLLASGRDLFHVPSVHLLTSYVLLKAGVLGLLWLLVMIATLVVLTVLELRERRPGVLAVLLLCLAWCGLAAAVPAATFFFSNPLCALSIGLLIGRRRVRRAAAKALRDARESTHGRDAFARLSGARTPGQQRGRHSQPASTVTVGARDTGPADVGAAALGVHLRPSARILDPRS